MEREFSEDRYARWMTIVAQHGSMLQYVPRIYRTNELCWAAVKSDPMVLFYVPKELRTPDMCEMAVALNPNAVRFVPWEFRVEQDRMHQSWRVREVWEKHRNCNDVKNK